MIENNFEPRDFAFAAEQNNHRRIAFNTDRFRLRRETRRVLLYEIDPYFHMTERRGFLPPPVAIFLSLCNGKRTQWEVVEAFRYAFGLGEWTSAFLMAKHMSESLIIHYGHEIFVDTTTHPISPTSPEYDPLNFVIEAQQVHPGGLRLEAPLDLNFIVTQNCYRRCVYCYAETTFAPSFELISVSRFSELMEEARELEMNSILFGGGEPFYRKDIVRLLQLAMDAKLWPFISTKAYLTPKVCGELRDINLPVVQTSIDSHRPRVADFMAGSTGYFDQCMATIRNLRENGIRVRAKTVVTPFNVFDVGGILRLLFKLGVQSFHFVRYGRSAFRHRDNLFIDNDALRCIGDEIESFQEENPQIRIDCNFPKKELVETKEDPDRAKRFAERSICGIGRSHLTMLPDGKAFACEQLPTRSEFCFGDLRRQSIRDVWDSDDLRRIMVPPRELLKGQLCYDCELFEECHAEKGRCIRNAYILYGNAYAPDPLCPKAPPPPRWE